jgi:molecular chaperone GrpE
VSETDQNDTVPAAAEGEPQVAEVLDAEQPDAQKVPGTVRASDAQKVPGTVRASEAAPEPEVDYLALAQRTQADFENFRKRAAKERTEAEARGVAKLARELLPALDNLDRAIAAAEAKEGDAEHHLTSGIRLVQGELAGALTRVGLETFSPHGEVFDPNEHEAMSKAAVEGVEAGTVAEVWQPGYRLNGAVLRPARVVVAE